jgi:hypothetical protein
MDIQTHADRFLLGLDLMEDPWGAVRAEAEVPGSGPTGLYCAAGLWGMFLGTAIWWSYALVNMGQPAATIVAQIP